MSDVVFILGAGASVHAGAPVMANFLNVARDLLDGNRLPDERADIFRTVFEGINHLQQVHSKGELNIHNVESVFAGFEMARTLQRLADCSSGQIREFTEAMKVLILETLEQTVLFSKRHHEHFIEPPDHYSSLAHLLHKLQSPTDSRAIPRSASVITFNYDVAFDVALYKSSFSVNYGLSNPPEKVDAAGLDLMKLHGSTNWAVCPGCNSVHPWSIPDYAGNAYEPTAASGNIRFPIGTELLKRNSTHCEKASGKRNSGPFIVPPTWDKTRYHEHIESVWQLAARHLSEARFIIVIGYSLPDTDHFFRLLYALGSAGKDPLRRFVVMDPDSSGGVAERFRSMLGAGALSQFEFAPVPFSGSALTALLVDIGLLP